MNAKDILDIKGRKVYSIDENATIFEAASELAKYKIGLLIIKNPAGDISGVLSERDIIEKVISVKKNPLVEKVKSVMTPKGKLLIASEADSTQSIMNTMTKSKIRHVLVFNRNEMAGVISIGDIVKSMLDEKEFEIKTLTDYISGKYPG